MDALTQIKDSIANKRGFTSWEVFENFVIDHNNKSVVVAQILIPAMEEVAKECAIQSFKLARNYPDETLLTLKSSLCGN